MLPRAGSPVAVRLATVDVAGDGRDPPGGVEVLAALVDHAAPGRRVRGGMPRPRNESMASRGARHHPYRLRRRRLAHALLHPPEPPGSVNLKIPRPPLPTPKK